MFAPIHDFFRAIHQARKATRRGDAVAAERWLRIADRHLTIYNHLTGLATSPPDPADNTQAGPVMLDPKGFSPGGTPNWLINRRRRERAGLDTYSAYSPRNPA
jgi:hypothetical protein